MEDRKYINYKIVNTYLNGDKETILRENYKSNNYKDMLRLYRETKEEFQDQCVTISFIGITNESKTSILFEKKFITEDLLIKERAEKLKHMESITLLKNLENAINDVLDKRKELSDNICVSDKKQNIIAHELETNNYTSKQFEDKGREIQTLRRERRIFKIEKKALDKFFDEMTKENFNLTHMRNVTHSFDENEKEIIVKEQKKYVPLTPEKVEEFKIMRTFRYKSFKDKIKIMKRYKNQYDRIINNTSNMTLICYNKAK